MPGLSPETGVHRYKFTIDGKPPSNIKSVTQLTMKLDPIITKTVGADGMPSYGVFAGNKQYVGSMTVTRLITEDKSWYAWFEATLGGIKQNLLNCNLEVLNADSEVTRTYTFESCMPNELKISDMNATTAQAAEETLTFHYSNMIIV